TGAGALRTSAVALRAGLPILAWAVLPASSVTLRTELIGPSASVDRSAVPAEAATVTVWLAESVKVTVADVRSASSPEVVDATAGSVELMTVLPAIASGAYLPA